MKLRSTGIQFRGSERLYSLTSVRLPASFPITGGFSCLHGFENPAWRSGLSALRIATNNRLLASAIAAWSGRTITFGAAGASGRATVWMFGGHCNRRDLCYLGIWLPGRDTNKELLSNRLKAQLLPYVLPGYSLNNSTFCPHSVFTCFEWIWEQTAIIALYSINWLVFITEIYPFKSQWSLHVPQV